MPLSRRHFFAAIAGTLLTASRVHGAQLDAEQKRIAESFAARSVGSKIVYDENGNVVKLAISRHTGRKDDDPSKMPPGVSDAEFSDILKLPRLEAVFIEKMPLSDASYALLAQLKHLNDVRIHYPTQSRPLPNSAPFTATDRFAQFINQRPGLRVLQLKHIFGMKGDGMTGLAPQPELEHLEIDTVCAKSSAVAFITATTRLKNLQVHRCEWTDAELQTVLAALPQLDVLELKPNRVSKDPITGRSLRGLASCRKLRLVQLTGQIHEFGFADELEVLTTLPELRQVNLIFKDLTIDSSAVRELHQARPNLLIRIGSDSLGGEQDQKPITVDDGYDWGGTVTTHG